MHWILLKRFIFIILSVFFRRFPLDCEFAGAFPLKLLRKLPTTPTIATSNPPDNNFQSFLCCLFFRKPLEKKIWSNKWEKWFLFMPCFCHYLHAVSAAIFFLSVTFFAWCLSLLFFLSRFTWVSHYFIIVLTHLFFCLSSELIVCSCAVLFSFFFVCRHRHCATSSRVIICIPRMSRKLTKIWIHIFAYFIIAFMN